jgi:hypothetical protein
MNYRNRIYPLLLAASLTACGGGSSDVADGGISGTGISVGAITGFGSLVINDDRFNTDNAEVFRGDDRLNDVTELEIGMRVRIEGDLDDSIATRVSFDEDVKGPVDDVNPLVVMGQTVQTDDGTHYSNVTRGTIQVGDVLEISGTRLDNDDLLATFIERKSDPVNKYKVIGVARSVNTGAMTLMIDGLQVRYGTAQIDDDFAGGQPTEGQLVEVHQQPPTYAPNDPFLSATKIEPADALEGAAIGNRVEIQSVVVDADSAPASFELYGGVTVHTSATTSYRYGTAADIAVNSALQVRGTRRDDGGIDANRIKFRDNAVRVDAYVDDTPVSDPTLAARTIRVLKDIDMPGDVGVLVKIPDSAELEDNSQVGEDPFEFIDITVNDFLEIRGFIGADGVFVATEVKRDDADNDVSVRAVVTAADADQGTVQLLGRTINTDDGTQYEGVSGTSTNAAGFFAAVEVGVTTVEAEWRLADPDPLLFDPDAPVRKLEFEDFEDDD